jgi:glutathione synthase/RimK-type ligase-like ATP-grasp enzyme
MARARSIAFLTAEPWRALYDDDRLAATALAERDVRVTPVVWTDADAASLERFDAVVMRTPWDWYRRRPAFRDFLALLRRVTVPVFNPPDVMAELADKTALPRLASQRGVRIVPTEVFAPSELPRVPARLAELGWARAVLKPAFTANAYGARRFDAGAAPGVVAQLAAEAEDEPWLLQPFLEEIAEGERSFVFFDDVFSHAVVKRPGAGDWRVQVEHGGHAEPWAPTPGEVAEAADLLRRAAPGLLYARVDGVVHDGRLHLMELEVVEPELFFRFSPEAPARFADALLRHM